MKNVNLTEGTLLGALASARVDLSSEEILKILDHVGLPSKDCKKALNHLADEKLVKGKEGKYTLTQKGVASLLDYHASLEEAIDPNINHETQEDCPSVPWLTLVKTRWIEAISINFSVSPDLMASLLPSPLEPEIHKDRAWVQVLISSLEDMRPEGGSSFIRFLFLSG